MSAKSISRQSPGFLVVGSAGAAHAPCPVTVVRDPGLAPTRGSAPESRLRDDAVGVGG
ncbi:MAG: hypothetical protein ACXV5Q_17665 [Frankiaceae bacterium]